MTKNWMIGTIFIFSLLLAGSDSNDMTAFVWSKVIALAGFIAVFFFLNKEKKFDKSFDN